MEKIGNKLFSTIGFVACVVGISGLLLGHFLFYIFPVPLFCGILLIKNKKSTKDVVSGITCVAVTGILIFYLFVAK